MAQAPWDVIIVGQGLAGTTLAWHLLDMGQRVLILDACEPVTSSKIAAGLITPITGLRLVLSWRVGDFLPAARRFYTGIEERTGQTFFHDRVALRLFKSQEEQQNWSQRSARPDYELHVLKTQPEPLLAPDLGDAGEGGFAMHSAQLDVAAYLDASRSKLAWRSMSVDWANDVSFEPEGISVRGEKTRFLVSCEGFAATRNPYFSHVTFQPAKGDILTVRFHRPVPPQCLHRGIWMAPTAEPDIFRIGSTYDWVSLDQVPSASARSELERKLEAFFHVPYTVLDHKAAVRPIITQSKALVGLHPEHERLGYFNGLGSKGSLHAPLYARHLSDLLVRGTPLPEDMDIRKQF